MPYAETPLNPKKLTWKQISIRLGNRLVSFNEHLLSYIIKSHPWAALVSEFCYLKIESEWKIIACVWRNVMLSPGRKPLQMPFPLGTAEGLRLFSPALGSHQCLWKINTSLPWAPISMSINEQTNNILLPCFIGLSCKQRVKNELGHTKSSKHYYSCCVSHGLSYYRPSFIYSYIHIYGQWLNETASKVHESYSYMGQKEQNEAGCIVTSPGLAPWVSGFQILEIKQLLGLSNRWGEDYLAPCFVNGIWKGGG